MVEAGKRDKYLAPGCPLCGYRCGCCCICDCQTPCPNPDGDCVCEIPCHGGHEPWDCHAWRTRYEWAKSKVPPPPIPTSGRKLMTDEPIIDKLERLEREATEGPWGFCDTSDRRGHEGEFRAPGPLNGFMLVGPWTNPADAALIVAMRNALPALLSQLREQRGALEHIAIPLVHDAEAQTWIARAALALDGEG